MSDLTTHDAGTPSAGVPGPGEGVLHEQALANSGQVLNPDAGTPSAGTPSPQPAPAAAAADKELAEPVAPIDGIGSLAHETRHFNTTNHKGVDWAVPEGAPVHAVLDGVVAKNVAGDSAAGNYLVIYHPDRNMITRYLHLSSPSTLAVGDAVTAGTAVGQVGHTGVTSRDIEVGGVKTGDHLHFEVREAESLDVAKGPNLGLAAVSPNEFLGL